MLCAQAVATSHYLRSGHGVTGNLGADQAGISWDTQKTPEQDVHEEHLYRELLGVTKDPAKIIPHELRYPDLKRQDYRGRKEKRGR